MHYIITITRAASAGNENEHRTTITRSEWHKAIESNPLFEFDIGLNRQDLNYAELLDGSNESWFQYEDSNEITAENPSPLLIYHLILLAKQLKAEVIGENSEFYELNEFGFQSRVEYEDEDRVHRWVKINTESGFNFKPETV